MADWFSPLAELLVPRDPRAFLGELLKTVRTIADAAGGTAIFSKEQGELKLALSVELDQATLDAASRLWSGHREALARGEVVPTATERAVAHGIPVRSGEKLVGLLVVTTAGPLRDEAVATVRNLAQLAAPALTAEPAATADRPQTEQVISAYLGRTPADDVLRDQMLGLLTANEWNVSRVARLLGVTRRTVYMRLERWGLERIRVRVGKGRPAKAKA